MTDRTIKELQSLRWVAEARKTKKGYAVRTKPNAFKAKLTHKIVAGYGAYDNEYESGSALTTPTVIYLPQYWFYLYDPALTGEAFKFSLAAPPNARDARIGIVPQYQYLIDKKYWGTEWIPCYGHAAGDANSQITYMQAKTWRDRANEVAIYLQSAVPHYNKPWYTTAFAYRLGLVGDEYRDDLNKTEAVAEAETIKKEQ